ncbi:MAG: discoidin domain-containing protein, partial [Melioribacteraceae bacterium]|nr:discoidin domain-containing protein [Melioribacteraceae bacterium]
MSNTNWSIVDFSSQQSEGPGHAATNFIDGNIDTFWHSQTNFSTTDTVLYPQFITVDLGASVNFSTVAIYNGHPDWVPAKIEILVAETDVNNFVSLGEFDRDASPAAEKVQQNHNVTLPGPVRYIRIVATEPGPNAYMPNWGTEFV